MDVKSDKALTAGGKIRFFSSGVWLGAIHASVDIVGFVRGWLVGREFGPSLFGSYQTMLLANQLASALTAVNEWKYLSQTSRDEIEELADKIFSFQLLRSVLTACLVFLTVPVVVSSTTPGVDLGPFFLLSLIPLLGGIGSPGVALAARRGQYWKVAFVQLTGQLLALGAAVLFLQGTVSLYTGAAILISLQISNLFASYLVAPRRPRWRWDPKFARTLLAFGLPLLVDGLLFTGIRWGELATISHFGGVESVGYWGVVVMMARNPFLVLIRVWNGILLPKFADEVQEVGSGSSLFFGTIWLGFGINILGFLGTVALVEALLVPLFGTVYEPGRAFIIPAAAISSAYACRVMVSLRVLVLGKTKFLTLATFVTALGLGGFAAAVVLGMKIESALWGFFFGELAASLVWLRLFSARESRMLLFYLVVFGSTVLLLGTFVGPEISALMRDLLPVWRE